MGFTKHSYYQRKFVGISLTKEVVREIEFEECGFTGCSFLDCEFVKCRFINCKFDGCSMSAIVPTESTFVDITFVNSKVIGFDWTKVKRIQGVSFDHCKLNYSNFRLLKLHKLQMVACEAQEVDFTEADLTEGNFKDTDFERSVFSKTNLSKADLKGARNFFIDARYNNIKKAHFSLPEALSLLDSLDVVID